MKYRIKPKEKPILNKNLSKLSEQKQSLEKFNLELKLKVEELN